MVWFKLLFITFLVESYCFLKNSCTNCRNHHKTKQTKLFSTSTSPSDIELKAFLSTLLSSRSKDVSKKEMIERLGKMRSQQTPRSSSGSANDLYSGFLDKIILEVETVRNNRWATKRWPFPLPSYRIKLGSLLRLYDTIVSDEMKIDNSIGTEENIISIKRRAISVLLNQLKSSKGVRSLEREARDRMKSTSMTEMLQRTPDLETPEYTVLATRKTWEIRNYKPFSVCSFNMDENSVGPNAFNRLAGYIFGSNQEQSKMAMTTPVIFAESVPTGTDQFSTTKERKMSFIMPSKYWNSTETLSQAPTPLDDSGVQLETDGGGFIAKSNTMAVLWFGGYATKASIAKYTQELLSNLESDQEWMAVENQQPYSMQYNDPFQPPWKRRNEVAIPVIPRQ